jgi:hypothetical protein
MQRLVGHLVDSAGGLLLWSFESLGRICCQGVERRR